MAELDINNHPSPRPTSVPVPGLADCSLLGGVKSTSEVGTKFPPLPYCEFNIAVSSLPEKPGFLPEFQVELEAVGGIIHRLTTKLLSSFNLVDSGKFRLSSFVKFLSNLSLFKISCC